jgi:putative SOS response-associated peptidase YedK
MCGRVACSYQSIEKAEEVFLHHHEEKKAKTSNTICHQNEFVNITNDNNETTTVTANAIKSSSFPSTTKVKYEDNFNLSPGMKSIVFMNKNKGRRHHDEANSAGTTSTSTSTTPCSCRIVSTEQTWGIVPKAGTSQNPIPPGPSKHYSNLMFNARSDTLYDKRTFSQLLAKKQTCICAIDGYYEWKVPDGNVVNADTKKKQPYYVYRKKNDQEPLYIAGLWTSIKTGRWVQGSEETLETFTMLTTDAKSSLQWLHHRQPVIINNVELATEWLLEPSKALLHKISSHDNDAQEEILSWHPVTKQMSSTKYRGKDCTDAIIIEKVPSIKSFFGRKRNHNCMTKNTNTIEIASVTSSRFDTMMQNSSESSNSKKKQGIKHLFNVNESIASSSSSLQSIKNENKRSIDNEVIDLTDNDVSPPKRQQRRTTIIDHNQSKRYQITDFFKPKRGK